MFKRKNKTILTFIDIETTDLDVETTDIIEIGYYQTDSDFMVIDKGSWLVKLQTKPTTGNVTIHKITNQMLEEKGLPIKKVLKKLNKVIKGTTLVAHNGEQFDFPILVRKGLENGVSIKLEKWIDTYVVAKTYFNFESNSLNNILTKEYGYEHVEEHRALPDAFSVYVLLLKLVKGISKNTVGNFLILTPNEGN